MSEANVTREPSRSHAVLEASLREGWRQSRSILTEMFDVPVVFTEPVLDDEGAALLAADSGSWVVGMSFTGGSNGLALLLVSRVAVRPLVVALLGEAAADPDDALPFLPTTVVELGNVVLNSVVAEIGRALGETYRFELPALLSRQETTSRFETATAGLVLVGEATVDREPPSPVGIGLLLDDPSWITYA